MEDYLPIRERTRRGHILAPLAEYIRDCQDTTLDDEDLSGDAGELALALADLYW
jgi:hypothetical protein